jgi:hypothetical protein
VARGAVVTQETGEVAGDSPASDVAYANGSHVVDHGGIMKILSKERVRSEKGLGRQAKRWRNAGRERAPMDEMAVPKALPVTDGYAPPRGRKIGRKATQR